MLKDKLKELISACFTGVWVESHESHEALTEIAQLCQENSWQMATWDIDRGLIVGSGDNLLEATDPLAAIKAVGSMATSDGATILVMNNLHKFISSTEILQALQHQLHVGKQNRTIVVGLSPVASIPTELEKLFVVVEHTLPDREQLEAILRSIATEDGELPGDRVLQTVLDAACGLTRLEAENAFSLSLSLIHI